MLFHLLVVKQDKFTSGLIINYLNYITSDILVLGYFVEVSPSYLVDNYQPQKSQSALYNIKNSLLFVLAEEMRNKTSKLFSAVWLLLRASDSKHTFLQLLCLPPRSVSVQPPVGQELTPLLFWDSGRESAVLCEKQTLTKLQLCFYCGSKHELVTVATPQKTGWTLS